MSNCRYAGRENPRLLTGRHHEDCAGVPCAGCQPCTEPHCRVCGHAHADGSCAECLAETRTNLREIARMCHALPAEVAHRGVEGEALMLLGPIADIEARQHVEASYLAGRLPEGWIEAAHGKECPLLVNDACTGCAGGERHPLTVLLGWQMVWRDALEHGEANDSDLATAVDYLDMQLTYMAGYPHVPFEDFAADLRRTEAHLESVLHDGEQHDTGAPCMKCGAILERTWGKTPKDDGWKCDRCKQVSNEGQYRLAVAHLHMANADWLTDRDMEIRTGVKAGTVRSWARATEDDEKPAVRKRKDSERTVYSVVDVEATARAKGLVA